MEIFKNQAAQGDMFIRVVDKLPDNVKEADDEKGNFVLAHSETGHNHIVKKQPGVSFYSSNDDAFVAYLVVEPKKLVSDNISDARISVAVEHLRDHDTHETISFLTGDFFDKLKDKAKKVFEIRRQREYTPEGFRRAQD